MFSSDAYQRNIAFSVVHVQVCFESFSFINYYISFLQTGVAAYPIKHICTSGWFVPTENNNCTPNTNN